MEGRGGFTEARAVLAAHTGEVPGSTQQAVWNAIHKTQARHLGLIKAVVDFLASVDDQHNSKDVPLKFTVPYGAVNALRAALEGQEAAKPCQYCDGTGDVHTPTGEWRGRCTCPAGRSRLPATGGEQG